jgi:glycosyltransferase involved in cell wall biosynthesis
LALVYSSYAGPENLPPLEAMARRKPIICSNYPGAKEQLKNIPFYFNPNNPSSIAKALDKFLLIKKNKNYFVRKTSDYIFKVLNEL